MATLDDRIADVARYDKGYEDSELWLRLEPKLTEELIRAVRAVVVVPLPDYATYRDKLGYVRGLQWVMTEAEHLTRREPMKEAE